MPIENVKTPAKKAVPAAEFKAPDVTDDQADNDDVKAENTVPVPAEDEGEYIYVQLPDGTYRAIRKSQVQQVGVSDAAGNPEVPVQDVYVHLANGDVERVAENELPGSAGTNAQHGHFVKDGHTHTIIGVYPVETENPKKG
jgi:hypothetical protein